MNAFSIVSELSVGSIVEVAGTSIRVELDGSISELTRTYAGHVYPIGQFASVIKIHHGRRILVAYVRLLRMRSELALETGSPIPPRSEDARILDADLFGECIWDERTNSLSFTRGVKNYPLPGQSVYLTTQEELEHLYRRVEELKEKQFSPLIQIGTYVGAESTKCFADIDSLFGMHCAVLGSTGSGKSAAVAALLHSILDHRSSDSDDARLRPRAIIIDPHNEYSRAFPENCVVYRAYSSATAGDDDSEKQLKLPYWLMNGEEFRDLVIGKTEYEATSENNIVYKALRHARLVYRGWVEGAADWEGESVDAGSSPEDPRPVDEAAKALISEYDLDIPDPFSLDEFQSHIRKEQGVRVKSGKWEKLSPSGYQSHASVLNKLTVLRSDPRLSFMMADFSDGDPNLVEILQQFVGRVVIKDDEEADLRIVDISGLPNEVAGPLTASIARLLFQYKLWQSREERERDPVLLVCEEAHRYVPDVGLAEYQSAQKAIRRLAKEGRKYGVGLLLVSQRPSDLERTVLSQCSSWIVMRLTNPSDQAHVRRFLPDNLSDLSRLLPSLTRQEAIFVGEAATVPARIMITNLDEFKLPRSENVSFVKGWSEPPVDAGEIETVVKRWRQEAD